MSYPKKPHEGYDPANEPISAELAAGLPPEVDGITWGPDAIIRTTEPINLSCNRFEAAPYEREMERLEKDWASEPESFIPQAARVPYEPPKEPLREEVKRLEEELGVEWAYPGSGGSSTSPDAPLNPFAAEGLPPMREWKPFIPQALVHGEFEKLESWLDQWDRNIEETRVLNERLKRGETVTLNLGEGAAAPEPLPLISEVRRLIARYKELWDIASGIVNSENLKEGE